MGLDKTPAIVGNQQDYTCKEIDKNTVHKGH